MPRDILTGTRIRERRTLRQMRQSQLAQAVGISASYLNLIEHNRRRIGGKLLLKIAEALGVEPSLLTEGAEATHLAELRETAAEATSRGAELDRVEEFAGRFPGWAGLVAEQHRRIRALEHSVDTLSDRLTHDPHLAAAMHEVLSTVTAIRSTASILAEDRNIAAEWRERFHRNLNEDAGRLAASSQALVAYLDRAEDAAAEAAAPQEEAERFLSARGFHLNELEEGAALNGAEDIESPAARHILDTHAARYAADAARMPLDAVRAALAETGGRPDPLALAARFGTDAATAMRRLAALPREVVGADLGLAISDASGALIFRRPVSGFALPRFGAACPLWPLFAAFGCAHVPVRQVLRQAGRDGGLFEAWAIALPVAAPQPNSAPLLEATMLLVPLRGPDPSPRAVGVGCRICPQGDCPGRREPSILAEGF
ncbi:helix-turn-helix domain-containing protein [Mesobacterium pallidum]|uniref:helix-turn-helix domain-containing protein n=1 Tax=Mesobacterium pallidum TaxID=2872037 RepID=UPI001EE2254C|nr:helix-turn-helix transcriptional regulator [Mesobacterium pallidum]